MKKLSLFLAAITLFISTSAFGYEVTSSVVDSESAPSNWVTLSGFALAVPIEKQSINDALTDDFLVFSPSIAFEFLDVHEDSGFTIKSGIRLGTTISNHLPNQLETLAWGFHFDADAGFGFTIMPTDSFFFSILGTARVMYNSSEHSKQYTGTANRTQEFSDWSYLFGGEIIMGFFKKNGSGTYIGIAGGWVPGGDAKYGYHDENNTSEIINLNKRQLNGSFAVIPTIGWIAKL